MRRCLVLTLLSVAVSLSWLACGDRYGVDDGDGGEDASLDQGSDAPADSLMGDAGSDACILPPRDPSLLQDVIAISAGRENACAVVRSGELYCWGNNVSGRMLGPDFTMTSSSARPHKIAGLPPVRSVDVGWENICAIATSGALYCWGKPDSQGHPYVDAGLPGIVQTQGGGQVTTAIAVSTNAGLSGGQGCAVVVGGALLCWGFNEFGQLGPGGAKATATPVIGGGVDSVVVGDIHTCVLRKAPDPEVACFGSAALGQFGPLPDGGTGSVTPFVMPLASIGVVPAALAATFRGTCILDAVGRIYCMGDNASKQFGNLATPVSIITPVQGLADGRSRGVAMSPSSTCALRDDATLACLGLGALGRETDGGPSAVPAPVVATGTLAAPPSSGSVLSEVRALAMGGSISSNPFGCAIVGPACADSGTVVCWGANDVGQLGVGVSSASPIDHPVPVVAP